LIEAHIVHPQVLSDCVIQLIQALLVTALVFVMAALAYVKLAILVAVDIAQERVQI
jgi:uncharacterized membrane protein YqjE